MERLDAAVEELALSGGSINAMTYDGDGKRRRLVLLSALHRAAMENSDRAHNSRFVYRQQTPNASEGGLGGLIAGQSPQVASCP